MEKAHRAVFDSQALPALFLIASKVDASANYGTTLEALSAALMNISVSKTITLRVEAVRAGIVLPLLSFARLKSEPVLECCATALHGLSEVESNVSELVRAGILDGLSFMLESGSAFSEVMISCLAALTNIARLHPAAVVNEDKLVFSVLRIIQSTRNPNAHDLSCSVVTSISFKAKGREILEKDIVVPVILALFNHPSNSFQFLSNKALFDSPSRRVCAISRFVLHLNLALSLQTLGFRAQYCRRCE